MLQRVSNYTRILMASAMVVAMLVVPMVAATSAGAAVVEPFESSCSSAGGSNQICKATGGAGLFGENSLWSRIIEALIYAIGAVSVIMIVIGGIRYVTSNGDQAQVTAAKNTILYAIVGIVVAFSAQGILSFVLQKFFA